MNEKTLINQTNSISALELLWLLKESRAAAELLKNPLQSRAYEVLTSGYVRSVRVVWLASESRRLSRVYSCYADLDHKYIARFFETEEGEREGRCNCAAGMLTNLCRHLIAASVVDSQIFDKPLNLETVASYQARAAAHAKTPKFLKTETI